MARNCIAVFALTLCTSHLSAEVASKLLEYKHDTTVLEGVLVYDSATSAKRPGILLAHEQGASSAISRNKATAIARQGYVVFSIDLFGKGITTKDSTDAASRLRLAEKDRTLIRGRTAAALAAIQKSPFVDPKRLAAIGYGIGGTAVLELARDKAELDGVVCVHGDLTPTGNEGKNVGASLLILVGADDPKISLAQVGAFEDEMRKGGVDWQLVRYGGVVGDFTNPQAGRNSKSGRAYDEDADHRASDAIRLFLAETFRPTSKSSQVAKSADPKTGAKGVPEKVMRVLDYVDKHGEAMDGYEGGRSFGNFERRLPQTDDKGRRIKYHEWDVNPLRTGANRGTERLVTGSDGSAHYTDDHYSTFKKIR